MVIRRATIAETAALAELAVQLWEGSTVLEFAESFTDLVMNNDNAACFLAYEGNQPVGFAQCQLRRDYVEGTETCPVGYLEGIFVREEFRRQGIASQLLEACQRWTKAKGCVEFASDCELDNEDSLRFHLKMGFVEANRIICFTKQL